MATELSAAEAQVLLKPNRAAAGEAVKVTLLSLLAQGLVRIEEETKKGRFRVRKTVFIRPTDRTARALPPHAVSLLENVRAAQAATGSMQDLVAQVRRAYGSGLEGFKKRFILPALESRGLIQKGRVLWIFPNYRLTPAGMAEKSRIESDIARARTIPGLPRQQACRGSGDRACGRQRHPAGAGAAPPLPAAFGCDAQLGGHARCNQLRDV
jgi:hypothetical protein